MQTRKIAYTQNEWDEMDENVDFSPYYKDHTRRLKYRSTKNNFKFPLHWGQRKLLIGELEFLIKFVKYAKAKYKVVYAGAAPGQHISLLAELFPNCNFYLYDPAPFMLKEEGENVYIFQEPFTDETAKTYSKYKRLLFISDVRTKTEGSRYPTDEDVVNDMMMQQNWHIIMNPISSLMKFRLPYDNPKTLEYLDGEIMMQAWAPHSSTETRIVVEGIPSKKIYDCKEYEERMYRFNTITRCTGYPEYCVDGQFGYDCCYDCVREQHVMKEYKTFVHPDEIDAACKTNKNLSLDEFPHGHLNANRTFKDNLKDWNCIINIIPNKNN